MYRDLETKYQLPTVSCYGPYSGAYGTHALLVRMPTFELWYSYETIVAYSDNEDGLVVSENCWGPTTGKHLNAILSDKKARFPRGEFERKLEAMLKRRLT